MSVAIQLSGKKGAGKFAKVSIEDAASLKGCKLYLLGSGYVLVAAGKERFYIHRWIMNQQGPLRVKMQVDHKNQDKLDNTRENLRWATSSQNIYNRTNTGRRNKCGYRGVSFSRGRYQASISQNRKSRYLGRFLTAEEAHQAYLKALKEIAGEFAPI